MKTLVIRYVIVAVALGLLVVAAFGDVPRVLTIQGKLTDSLGQTVPDGVQSVTFRLYDVETGGTALWQEVQNVQTNGGLFNANLGAVTPITLSFDKQYWLGMQPPNCGELCPRTRLTTAPYAVVAGTVVDGAITTGKIADGAVNDAKVSSVDWSKLLNKPTSMPPSGAAGGDLSGDYPNPSIRDGAITSSKMAPGGAWRHSGATVYAGIGQTGWTMLDLSPYVGSNYSFVVLKVYSSETLQFVLRPHGDPHEYAKNTDFGDYGANAVKKQGMEAAIVVCETDSAGRIDFNIVAPPVSVQITLLGYLR